MVSFLNHIVSILYERGRRCGAVYYPLYYIGQNDIKLHGVVTVRRWLVCVYNLQAVIKELSERLGLFFHSMIHLVCPIILEHYTAFQFALFNKLF